jgi:hypothetical protein
MSLYPNHPVVNIDGLEIVITPHEQARRLLLPADQQLVVDEFWKEHKAKAAAAGRSVKNNDIYGGEVVRLSDNKLEVRRDTIFTFAEVAARKTGHLVPPRSRWTAPSLIKFNITNVNAGGLDELSKNSDLIDTTFADRSGRYYGFGVHEPSNQLYVATGPMMTREFALQPNPLLEAFRARQLEFGLDIDESKHRFRFWFQDG